MASAIPARDLFVAGKWMAPVKGGRLPVVNPATEEEIGSIPAATSEDVDVAVQAARAAFRRNSGADWPRTSGSYRATFLRAIAAKVSERKSELGRLEALDCGKPLDEALWDMDDVSGCFEYYAGLAEQLDAQQDALLPLPMEQFTCRIRKEAMGVVGLITPWNYPLLMAAWKVAPALAAGCTVVLKPSEMASVTCLELASLASESLLPPGVLNVVTGAGGEAGAALAAHPGLDKVAFTGSSATGKSVLRAASENLLPVTMELGGKSALIVFDDVDIDKAVEWAMFGCFWTNGQICSATSRLLLHERIAPVFKSRLVEWCSSIKIGDPMEDGCRMGPLVSEGQYSKVLSFISEAQSEGAVLLCGGKRPAHLTKGYFLEPTVLEASPSMRVWREEVFGPVLAVLTFREEEEAVALANDTSYGLAAAVISTDQSRCDRMAKAMDVGIVWVNCSQPCFCQAPWGEDRKSVV